MNIAQTLTNTVEGLRGLFPPPRGLTPFKADPPPGEGHFGISNVIKVGVGTYYQPDDMSAAEQQAQQFYAVAMHGFNTLHARREAGMGSIYAGDIDALGLIPAGHKRLGSIAEREAARLALFAFVGQWVLRTEGVPAPMSDEAFLKVVKGAA